MSLILKRVALATVIVSACAGPRSAAAALIGGTIVTGAGASAPHVKRFNAVTLAETASFFAYPSFPGGVRVGSGDVNNDGTPDLITGPEAGGGPELKVFDGGNVGSTLIDVFAYSPSFTGGVYVAAGDINHDGRADVVTGPGAQAGQGPQVKVFNANGLGTLMDFFAYSPSFTGGVTVAAGDVNGDGTPDIITAPASGMAPTVRVFSGTNGLQLASFDAYGSSFTGGVYVAAGDVNGDGFADVITGAGSGASPHVKVFSGANLATELASFFAYAPGFTGGVRVAAADLTGDGRADLITGTGPGGGPDVRVFDSGAAFSQAQAFFAYPAGFTGGVFVAGSSVPEPATCAGALMILTALAVPRRRRHA